MINIGITGQNGFIGKNLVNYLKSFENISLIFFLAPIAQLEG